MPKRIFYLENFGIIKHNLYEVLATTYSQDAENDELLPNTSCMGIRLIENNLIKITPFPNTKTYKYLKERGIITLNFVMDVELYALAALKEYIPHHSFIYDYKEIHDPFNESSETKKIIIPYISDSWGSLICIIAQEDEVVKQDLFGGLRISEFKLYIIDFELIQKSFKFFNRAENLTLEAIILATRLKITHEKNDQVLVKEIQEKINAYIVEIKRFGKNKSALKAIEHVGTYIKNILV